MQWFIHPSSDDLRLVALAQPHNLAWKPVPVPSEWRFLNDFADHAGAVLYRTTFDTPATGPRERLFVKCGGIFDQADLWLDGAYLGDQDDYFAEHLYDITDLAKLEPSHDLVVEVNGGDHAGIWRPIELVTTGPAQLRNIRVLCRDASAESAHVLMTAVVNVVASERAVIRTYMNDTMVDERRHALSRGDNHINWTIDIDNPPLWWPHGMGEQTLTSFRVEVVVDGNISDSTTRNVGLREVTFQHFTCTVNGERVFLKGAYVEQPGTDLGMATDETIAAPVASARELGLNMIRVHNHVAHPAFYDAADRLGMLVLQDLPRRGMGKRGRRTIGRWVDELVETLGHHASVFAWQHRTLDQFTHRSLSRADPTRDSVGHLSTALPDGWRKKLGSKLNMFDALTSVPLETSIRAVPNLSRFVTHEELDLVPALRPTTAEDLEYVVGYLRDLDGIPCTGFCFMKLVDESVFSSGGLLTMDLQPGPLYDAMKSVCR